VVIVESHERDGNAMGMEGQPGGEVAGGAGRCLG
jgi:hypothetical protein